MGMSKITRNFQVTIPKDVREVRNLREGDNVIFAIEGSKIDVLKADKNAMKEAAGLWSSSKEAGLSYERRVRKGWAKRFKRETL